MNINLELLLQHKTIEFAKTIAGILPGLLYEIRRLLLLLFCSGASVYEIFKSWGCR